MHLNNLLFRKLVPLALFLFPLYLFSSHIVGGEIAYDYLRHNAAGTEVEYEVTLTMYRDPDGKEYNLFANFGVFEQDASGSWRTYKVVRGIPIGPITEVSTNDDPCKQRSLTDERLQSATYTFTVSLEVGDNNYLIAYMEGFRNFSINNIQGAGNIGSVYDVLITPEALRTQSSSPRFKDLPPIFICAGFDLEIDNSAVDPDGDIIIYSFCAPTFPGVGQTQPACCGCAAPNPELCIPPFSGVDYVAPYSATNPLGNQNVTVDSATGVIRGEPDITGSYVVGVCIEEYRNGVLFTETKRDFEFNVVNCNEGLIALIESDSYFMDASMKDSIAYIQTCGETEIEFINLSKEEIFIENYSWYFFDNNEELISQNSGNNLRDLVLDFPSTGQYQGQMILNEGENCTDTAYMAINIVPRIDPMVEINFDSCIVGPVSFEVNSSYVGPLEWNWKLGDGSSTSATTFDYDYDERGSYQIDLSVQDTFGCDENLSFQLDWFPYQLVAPDTIEIDTLICINDSIFINEEWVRAAGTYFNFLPSQFTGCDSIVERITLFTTDDLPIIKDNVFLCQDDEYFYNDQWLAEAGTYYDTLVSNQMCDSIIALSLDFYPASVINLNEGICEGDAFPFGDTLYTSPGNYELSLPDVNGCDSLTLLSLHLTTVKEDTIRAGFCENSSYDYNGTLITVPGEYTFELESVSGCDSIVTLFLESYQTYTEDITASICEGGIYGFGGDELEESGNYIHIYDSAEGCDSIVVLNLEVIEESDHEFQDTICLGETYAFGEIDLSLPGIYFDTLTNSNGCDSLIILDLVVGQNLTKINVNEALELAIGESIILSPDVRGGDLLEKEWSEVDEILSFALELDYLVDDDEWIYFRSTNELFCVALDSVFIRAILEVDLYFPNIISPDGDGINDIFNVGASETLAESQLSIFDRWGNLIYRGPKTDDRQIMTGWDGRYKGKTVEIGTYTYMLEAEFIDGSQQVFGGEVTVIR